MAAGNGARVVVPVAVAAGLTWLMVGCFYVPTWDRVQLRGTRADFRSLTGPVAGERRPIVAGRVTRRQVEALLGPAPYASPDGRTVAYTLTIRRGLWVDPLCLAVGSGSEAQVAIRLNYRPDGVVDEYVVRRVSHELRNPIALEVDENSHNLGGEYEDEPAVKAVDDNHGLRPTTAAPPPPFPERERRNPIHGPTTGP